MKKILVSILLLTVISCGAGWSDVLNDLGSGYFYYGEGSPANYIFYGKKDENYGWDIEKRIIYPNVSYYKYDENHIVVLQNPNRKAIMNTIISDPFYNEEERELAEKKTDSILKSDSYYQKLFSGEVNYWIISKKDHQVYGPHSKTEYEEQRKVLGVSKDLILEKE